MIAQWNMRVALATLEADAFASAPLDAWGLVLPAADGAVSFQLRHRWGTTVNILPAADLPAVLRTPIDAIRAASIEQGDGPIEEQLVILGGAGLVSIPLPNQRGLLWAAGSGPFTSTDVAALEALAARVVQQASTSEPEYLRALRHERLEAIADVLPLMTGALDVRDVFERLSEVSQRVIPHESAVVGIYSDDHSEIQLLALSGFAASGGIPSVVPNQYPHPLVNTREFAIVRDLASHPIERSGLAARVGFLSAVRMPLWLEGRLKGLLDFSSRDLDRYNEADLPIARRIADYIALSLSHQRLAEEAHRHQELRARTANLELLDELIASLTDTGELRQMFERISEIAKKVLPHDLMALPVALPDGEHARVYATSAATSPFPEIVPLPPVFAIDPAWEVDLIDDLPQHPEQRNLTATKLGYRSALRVPIRLEGRLVAALAFLSFEPNVFKTTDILIARRVADRVALSLSREQRAAASQRADEASARVSRLESRVRELTDELDTRTGYRRVIGESPEWRQVLTQAAQVAATDTTVLLLGESGTGKEVVARFVHRASTRSHGPFVAINCAAMPENLLESELFGYERGAFTGATQTKPGQIEQAAGGVLFLDEVGEMALTSQAKFLRVLQEREFQRLGGSRVLRADIRVIAATNRDLQKAMERGAFREDLFYRLNVFEIRLPPLRDRGDDIVALSEAFIAEIGRSIGRPPSGLSRGAREALVQYRWPGNVRELRNILERAAILCDGGLITPDHLALTPLQRPGIGQGSAPAVEMEPDRAASAAADVASADAASSLAPAGSRDLKSVERLMVERALADARYNKSRAARALGLTRAQLYVRMKRHGLE